MLSVYVFSRKNAKLFTLLGENVGTLLVHVLKTKMMVLVMVVMVCVSL